MTWEEYQSIVDANKERQKEYQRNAEEAPNLKNVYSFMSAGLTIALNIISQQYVEGVTE